MNRPSPPALAVLAVLASAVAGVAQDRGPAERQRLLDLAFAIGESHALRQVCQGAGDQYWRARMMRLTEVEKADQAFDAQLRDRFNTGFAAGQGAFPQCDEASRKAEQAAARRGQALASRLAQSMRTRAADDQAAPDSMADDEGAR
jgi:uncharacterized protein (TIGR02301 family)